MLHSVARKCSWRSRLLTAHKRMECLKYCPVAQVDGCRQQNKDTKILKSWRSILSSSCPFPREHILRTSYREKIGSVLNSRKPARAVGGVDIARTFTSAPSANATKSREAHNEIQEKYFDDNYSSFEQPVPESVKARVKEIVGAAALQKGERVLDVGAGAGALTETIMEAGVTDITAIDLSLMMLSLLKERFDDVTCWHGDVVDLPEEFGSFDAIFFHAMFGNVHSQEETLQAAIRVANPGCRIVISHPIGATFVDQLRRDTASIVPHTLPDHSMVATWTETLPLQLVVHRNEVDFYLSLLKVQYADTRPSQPPPPQPPHPVQEVGPLNPARFLQARVIPGFGRGSKQMGVPTANLPPEQLEKELEGMAAGVYYGWAQVAGVGGGVHPMVMNLGQRPTFVDGEGISVEVHVLHSYEEDFYGKEMAVMVVGYIRPEMKFSSLDELVKRIHMDIAIARKVLETEDMQRCKEDLLFG